MCGVCEFRAASRSGEWTLAGAATAADREAMKFRMAALLDRALAPDLAVTAVPGGFRLEARDGRALRLNCASDIWAGAARLDIRPFDPLDPAFVARAE